jgi:hypothetical protein
MTALLRALSGRAAWRGPARALASQPLSQPPSRQDKPGAPRPLCLQPLWPPDGVLHSARRPPRPPFSLRWAAPAAAAGLLSATACSDEEEDEEGDADEEEAGGGAGAAGGEGAQLAAAEARRARTSEAVAGERAPKTLKKYKPFVNAWLVRPGRGVRCLQ